MTVITMSREELTRLRVLIDIADGRLSVADATGLIGVGRRQMYRLLDAFRARGPDGLISRKRGRPSNRALGAVFRETVLGRPRFREIRPSGPRARNASSRRYICLRPTPISPVASAIDRRPSAISINTRRRVSSLRLIVITVIPRHLDKPHADCRA